jgi:hypothetical protein
MRSYALTVRANVGTGVMMTGRILARLAVARERSRGRKQVMKFSDLSAMPEDKRIKIIADTIHRRRKVCAVLVEDEPGKAERYADKLKAHGLTIFGTYAGPVDHVITLQVGIAS